MNIVRVSLFLLQVMLVVPVSSLAFEHQSQCDSEVLENAQEPIFQIDGINAVINDPCLEQDQTEIDYEQAFDELHEEDEESEQEDDEVDLGDEEIETVDYEEQEELLVSSADLVSLQPQSDTPTAGQLTEQQEVVSLPVILVESETQSVIEDEQQLCDSCASEQAIEANKTDAASYDLMDSIHMLLAKIKAFLLYV
ncbi:hypothetical protein JST99_02580 [Candidatus Dependentiae bacterium]|nr:hypothetical protein [Candidatus Dependentiae bacterium]MCC7414551.1 hypothetical protein [Campylobacterota bacterium]